MIGGLAWLFSAAAADARQPGSSPSLGARAFTAVARKPPPTVAGPASTSPVPGTTSSVPGPQVRMWWSVFAQFIGRIAVLGQVVGGPAIPDFIDRLAAGGRMILVGAVAGLPPTDFGMRLVHAFRQSRSYSTFSLDAVPIATWKKTRSELFDAAVAGHLHPVVHKVMGLVMGLDQATEAHQLMDNGAVSGRIVTPHLSRAAAA
jgi:NADPH2:quinone reductase